MSAELATASTRYQALTGSREHLAVDGGGDVLGAADKVEHAVNSIVMPAVDAQKNTLDGAVLVQIGVDVLSTASSGDAQELGHDEQAVAERLGVLRAERLLQTLGGVGLDLVELFGVFLLHLSLLGLVFGAQLVVHLLHLGEVLLELIDLGNQARLFLDLSLLVAIDQLGGEKFVERLVGVAADDGFGLGSVGLEGTLKVSEDRSLD